MIYIYIYVFFAEQVPPYGSLGAGSIGSSARIAVRRGIIAYARSLARERIMEAEREAERRQAYVEHAGARERNGAGEQIDGH